ncbi:caspase domain-containing protein [Lasiosphaeria hispida]|uniref:Caspase domain-containing protein n=1 Tax=Lasiosphaeria hispida TaxID=260671 RepID=A0AAJ0H7F5_9PEZI|nr:caspase domain-containing protein [Lasiosphaeria hispida]
MADEAGVVPVHWAILIGIDFYVQDRCLQGSVRDVQTVKEYLEAGPTPVDIIMLTAATPADPSSCRPIEEPAFWPTYDNIIEKLQRVLKKAKRGDFVYIHYSGHGTRRKDQKSIHSAGNLAFVLFEDNEYGSSYLMGKVLASCLRKMVEQGLLVTLVLDCCYSGSVLRADRVKGSGIRSIDYNLAVETASPQDPDLFGSDGTLRDAQIPLEQWLINPNGYTILAACGPHESAWELEIEGAKRGGLSYFLIEALSALRKRGVELTHQSLYQHLRIRFHASWPRQTPMRYGNKNFSFFGKLGIAPSTAFTPVYRADNGRLCLGAGEAHGVHKGDEYVVYPFNTPEDVVSRTSGTSVLLRVETVRCLTSDLVRVEEAPPAPSPVERIETGWKAKPVTCLSPHKVSVRLSASASSQLSWTEAEKQQRFLHLCTDGEDTEPCIFYVALNEHKEYEIQDGSPETIVGLPTIPLDMPRASDRIMNVLQHLAMFKFFEGVENRTPNPSFEDSFSLISIDGAGSSGVFDVRHGDKWGFRVENLGDRPLYLAIFNFKPSWQVTNLVSQAGGGDCIVVQPKGKDGTGEKEIRLRMHVPEPLRSRGEKRCEDIVKVFITSKQTSFPAMVLPEISLHAETLSRAARGSDDRLSEFLWKLATPFRYTTFRNQDQVQEDWASRNFIICTAMEVK